MEQIRWPVSLPFSKTSWRVVRFILKGVVVGLVLVWLAPLVSIAVSGSVLYRDSVVAVTACITRVPKALARVRDERSRTAAEEDAFDAFATRIETMDIGNKATRSTPKRGWVLAQGSPIRSGVEMGRVRAAYEETVMATPHYAGEYAEPLIVNATEEFGPDLATMLTHGDTLTPPLQRALVEASQTAATERRTYQNTLEDEYESLQGAKRHLRTLTETLDRLRGQRRSQGNFSALVDAHTHVEDLTADCASLLENRQTTLAEQPQDGPHHLTEYLYREDPWTYPVLADTLDCRAKLQEFEHTLVDAISRHP